MSNFQKLNKKEVKELLNKVLFKTFFHKLEWQEFLEEEFKWLRFEHYLYKNELLLSLVRFKVFGKEKLISLPFCEYGGPLPLKEEINFEGFKKDVLKEFDNIKIKFHPQILKFLKLEPSRFEGSTCTYWISSFNKVNEERLLSSFRSSTRQRIRKGGKEDLLISKCGNKQDLKEFYDIYAKTMKKNRTVCFPVQIFEFLWQKSLESETVDFLIIKHRRKIVSGIVVLFYSGISHYFLSAMDHKYVKKNKLNPMHFALWEEIKKLIDSGRVNIFDFGGTKIGSSLEEFKRGWDVKQYPICKLESGQKAEERLRASKLRNIWSILPNFLVKIISPYIIKYRL
jgi:hypothetical protein